MWQEPDLTEKQELFSGIVREAEPHERLLMLFSLTSRLLLGVGEAPSHAHLKARGLRALATLAFLRESLTHKPDDPFNGAFKRFYNHLHRQIIDAIRDSNPKGFLAAGRSIGILISQAHADVFIAHCLEQSEWPDHRLVFILDRLFAIAPAFAAHPESGDRVGLKAQESALTPLRSA